MIVHMLSPHGKGPTKTFEKRGQMHQKRKNRSPLRTNFCPWVQPPGSLMRQQTTQQRWWQLRNSKISVPKIPKNLGDVPKVSTYPSGLRSSEHTSYSIRIHKTFEIQSLVPKKVAWNRLEGSASDQPQVFYRCWVLAFHLKLYIQSVYIYIYIETVYTYNDTN